MSQQRALLVITNPHAGGVDDDVRRRMLEVLQAGADVDVAEADGVEELAEVLSRLDGRLPVVVGGDGSAHVLLAAANRTGRLDDAADAPFDFALVPAGTGNDLARTLQLPLDPIDAAQSVIDGRLSELDVLVDDTDAVVVNAVHLGVGAAAGQRAAQWKPRLGRLAYPAGAIAAGLSTHGWRLRVTVDGTVVADGSREVLMVAVGNGMTIGGGAPVAPPAEPDDGRADVVVSYSTGRLARIGFAAALIVGRHPHRDDVVHQRGRTITVAGGPVAVNADGEVATFSGERTWTVRRHAARVVVPA